MAFSSNGSTMSGCHLKRPSLATQSREELAEIERDIAYREITQETPSDELQKAREFLKEHAELYAPKRPIRRRRAPKKR